jgi:hypothetical protein
MVFMPIIKRFANCRVSINPKDHNPPHFHVRMNDDREAWVAIATLEILHGKVFVREIADVLDWARANCGLLADKFEELQQ